MPDVIRIFMWFVHAVALKRIGFSTVFDNRLCIAARNRHLSCSGLRTRQKATIEVEEMARCRTVRIIGGGDLLVIHQVSAKQNNCVFNSLSIWCRAYR